MPVSFRLPSLTVVLVQSVHRSYSRFNHSPIGTIYPCDHQMLRYIPQCCHVKRYGVPCIQNSEENGFG